MTPEQSDGLARRIVNTWRSTPKLAEWAEILTPLGYAQALDTYEHLRDTLDHGLSIARYRSEYRARTPRESTYGSGGPPISLDEYLSRHPDDPLAALRAREHVTTGGVL